MHEVTALRVAMLTNSPDYFWTDLHHSAICRVFLYYLFLIIHIAFKLDDEREAQKDQQFLEEIERELADFEDEYLKEYRRKRIEEMRKAVEAMYVLSLNLGFCLIRAFPCVNIQV